MPYRAIRSRLTMADTWLLEVFLSVYTLVWGLAYANPLVDTFTVNPRAYAVLTLLPGSELTYGLIFTALGGIGVGVTLWGGRQARSLTMATTGGAWLGTAFALAIPTQWQAGGVPGFILIALAHWFLWARLRYRGAD